ncbi:YceI family protein [Ottowia thiooxydans]|uniref:YceI family protein n=1 Tax=Ottowia thiooxydans TaxID=219182 RepID=UPI00048E34AD|nr:YceI family protein [Ottowia thiooxydans]
MRQSLTAIAICSTLAAALPAQAADYVTEPTHTSAIFEISHFGAGVNRARFDKEEGTIKYDPVAKTGHVELRIDAASISTGVPPFDGHLKGEQMFNVAKYPTIKFVSTKFHFDGDKVSTVDGQLTIKDKTHPVTLKATQFACYQSPMVKREVCGGNFEGIIDRTLWGMDYGLNMVAGKDVKLIATVEAIKQ